MRCIRPAGCTDETTSSSAGARLKFCAYELAPELDFKLNPLLPEIKPAEVTGILTDAGLPRASWKLTTGRNVTYPHWSAGCHGAPVLEVARRAFMHRSCPPHALYVATSTAC